MVSSGPIRQGLQKAFDARARRKDEAGQEGFQRVMDQLMSGQIEKTGADMMGGPTEGENFASALKDMKLTPEEQFLYQHHLDNLGKGGAKNGKDISTILQIIVGMDGRNYNLPTVWDNKMLKPDEAIKRAMAVGLDKFPSYPTPDEAQARYNQMHEYMNRDVNQQIFDSNDVGSVFP